MLLCPWQVTQLLHFGCGFLSPSVFVDFPFFVATLNGHSRDLVVPRLLTPHRQMEVHVQVLAHAIWTHQVQLQALG